MQPEIRTPRLFLRPLGPRHAAQVLRFQQRNREHLQPWEPLHSEGYYTLKEQKRLLRNAERERRAGSRLSLWIFVSGEAEPIGNLNFSNILRGPFQSCFVGYKLDRERLHCGYMSEALAAGVQYLFTTLGLHRVEANIMPANSPSIRVVEKLGFQYEGLSRRYLHINGRWEDHLRYVRFHETATELSE
jgi:ribosomal-protein-alanine N-acetyltransferase